LAFVTETTPLDIAILLAATHARTPLVRKFINGSVLFYGFLFGALLVCGLT
jgi:hypothetical protein